MLEISVVKPQESQRSIGSVSETGIEEWQLGQRMFI